MEKLNELAAGIKRGKLSGNWVAVDSEHILAIAEAFRALEQRAEAADAESRKLLKLIYEEKGVALRVVDERDALRTKMAELEKQKPIYQLMDDDTWYDAEPHIYHEITAQGYNGRIVYRRPAPAINLAELVPDVFRRDTDFDDDSLFDIGVEHGWNACRADILRNIEEAKK